MTDSIWKHISSAPKDGSRILLKSKNWSIADGYWSGRSWIWPYINLEPMYWMPIPD